MKKKPTIMMVILISLCLAAIGGCAKKEMRQAGFLEDYSLLEEDPEGFADGEHCTTESRPLQRRQGGFRAWSDRYRLFSGEGLLASSVRSGKGIRPVACSQHKRVR